MLKSGRPGLSLFYSTCSTLAFCANSTMDDEALLVEEFYSILRLGELYPCRRAALYYTFV